MKSDRILHSSGPFNILKEREFLLVKKRQENSNQLVQITFFENEVAKKFELRIGAKKSGHLGHSFRNHGFFSVKEQNERVYKCGRECNFFCRECKFASSQLDFMTMGMI